MTRIKDQPPRGGCVNCGGPVRTRKADGWVCAKCERRLNRASTLYADALIRRYGYGEAGHPFDPNRHGRCRKAGGGYCDGSRSDSQHEVRQ